MPDDDTTTAPFIPIVLALALTAAAMGAPYMTAINKQGGQVVETYTFYAWGQDHTVSGEERVESNTDTYGISDFVGSDSVSVSFISMLLSIVALIAGGVALLSSRDLAFTIRDRLIDPSLSYDPMLPLSVATGIMLMGYFMVPKMLESSAEALTARGWVISIGMGPKLMLGAGMLFGLAFGIYAIRVIREDTLAPGTT